VFRSRIYEHVRISIGIDNLDNAITTIVGPEFPDRFEQKEDKSYGLRFPAHVVSKCLARLERLKEKRQQCDEALARGTVSVDEAKRSVSILKPIEFATRKPPDTSAELEHSRQAEAIITIKDVALVLRAYMEKMIVEGHTGATEPASYWNTLAQNRANLICSILVENGVSSGLLEPIGVAGGGAKVLIYPAGTNRDGPKFQFG
jgi:outer membrane protein OmpA-like peptidoglycan-associated protein